MAFDLGFNFRGTSGYVTDQSYAACVLAESYPNTYTASNGYSINGGWTTFASLKADRVNTNDARLAGIGYWYNSAGGINEFRVDLSSGSAPGAGTYTVDLAMGDASAGQTEHFLLRDTTTTLIDGTGGGSGIATAAGHYLDATLADVAATTSWTGATASKAFATTQCNLTLGTSALSNFTTVAHFRLTLASAPAGIAVPVLMAHYRQRRA